MALKTSMRRFDVVCVGSASVDCFVKLPFDFSSIKHGSKLLIDDMNMFTGGGGSNVSVGLARLGMRTGFIGELGEDLSAHMIRNDFEKNRVRFLVKQNSRHSTAYSVVLESEGKDRAILVYKGASSFLHTEEIPKAMSTDWFYFASVTGTSFKTMERLSSIARKKKISVYFNPSSYMTKKGVGFLRRVISATTIIAMNKEEAGMLVKKKSADIKDLLRGLYRLGPGVCIITDGPKGAHAYDGRNFYYEKAHRMTPVDTTGAGDAFGAGFMAGFIMKKDKEIKERIGFAMKLGIMNSESVISFVGAKTGLLSQSDISGLKKKK